MNTGYDPNLRMAMAEIENICQKYDVISFVALNSAKHGEFKFMFPKWSCVQVELVDGEPAFRTKVKKAETSQEHLEASVGAMFSLAQILSYAYTGTQRLLKQLKENMEINHYQGPINNNDRGES